MKCFLLFLCLLGCTIATKNRGRRMYPDNVQEGSLFSGHYDDHDDFEDDYDDDDHDHFDDRDHFDDHDHHFIQRRRYGNSRRNHMNSFNGNSVNGFSSNNVAVQTFDNGDHTRVHISQNGYNLDYAVRHTKRCSKFGNQLNSMLNSGYMTGERARSIQARSRGCVEIYSITRGPTQHFGTQGPSAFAGQGSQMGLSNLHMGRNGMNVPGMHMGRNGMNVPGMHMGRNGMDVPGMHMGRNGINMAASHELSMHGNVPLWQDEMNMNGNMRRRRYRGRNGW